MGEQVSYTPFIEKPVKELKRGLTPIGEKTYKKTRYYFDKETGERMAEPGDEVNLDAYIQASAYATDLAVIYQKFLDGDETVVNVGEGIYGDLTTLPTDINDVVSSQKVLDKATASFKALPQEIQELFGNDVNAYFNAVLENKAQSIVKDYLAKQKEAVQPQESEVSK